MARSVGEEVLLLRRLQISTLRESRMQGKAPSIRRVRLSSAARVVLPAVLEEEAFLQIGLRWYRDGQYGVRLHVLLLFSLCFVARPSMLSRACWLVSKGFPRTVFFSCVQHPAHSPKGFLRAFSEHLCCCTTLLLCTRPTDSCGQSDIACCVQAQRARQTASIQEVDQ